ncbi:arginase family protein [Cryobacterium sp.]|uniref:arginase family protein n=1 Tax=Cryobacterium sp. TaxID=1926290 RepID=UPI002629CF01|nr:arginase family protein [Cryobacterium sp.]
MRLVDGAEAIKGDLPYSVTYPVDVPAEAGDSLDTGVHRYSSLLTVRDRQLAVLRTSSEPVLTIGGDCGVSCGAVEHASRLHPGDIALVWFDAHPDLHSSESSQSGGFGGMVLRAILGEGVDGLALDADARITPDRVVLAGVRDVDPAEDVFITEHAIPLIPVESFGSPDALVAAVKRTGAAHIYLHIDLDVLDPATIVGLSNIYPFGLAVEALTGAIMALRAEFALAGATIAGFAPSSAEAANDDLPSILRIISALTR